MKNPDRPNKRSISPTPRLGARHLKRDVDSDAVLSGESHFSDSEVGFAGLLTPDDDQAIFELVHFHQTRRSQMRDCPDEGLFAEWADQYLAGKTTDATLQAVESHVMRCPNCSSWLQQIAPHLGAPTDQPLELPDFLKSFTRAAWGQSGENNAPKSLAEKSLEFIVQLSRESMRLFHNASQPLRVFEFEGMALRGVREYPSIKMDQPYANSSISYQIFRENEDEVMLMVKLNEVIGERFSHIKLKKENRVISSKQFDDSHLVVFSRLDGGQYALELTGPSDSYTVKMALV